VSFLDEFFFVLDVLEKFDEVISKMDSMIFIATGGVFNLMGFSMASRSPETEKPLKTPLKWIHFFSTFENCSKFSVHFRRKAFQSSQNLIKN
jgi:hypothetical protein